MESMSHVNATSSFQALYSVQKTDSINTVLTPLIKGFTNENLISDESFLCDDSIGAFVKTKIFEGSCVPGYASTYKQSFGFSHGDVTFADWGVVLFLFVPTGSNGGQLTNGVSSEEDPSDFYALILAADEYEVVESYKDEIERYCQTINDSITTLKLSPTELTAVESQLNLWFSETVDYLRRSILVLEPVLSEILHAALMATIIEIEAFDPLVDRDLKKFLELCDCWTPLTLMTVEWIGRRDPILPPNNDQVVVITVEPASDPLESVAKVTLKWKNQRPREKANSYVDKWSEVLVKSSRQHLFAVVKHLINSFKVKALEDLRTLRKLLIAAENDQYALHGTVEYLRKTLNGDVLLSLVQKIYFDHRDYRNLIQLLDEYLHHNDGGDE